MMPKNTTISVSVGDMPEWIAKLRLEVAKVIRNVADDEEPKVAARLNEIAAVFEAGQFEDL